jgi:hypothetical protein
MKAWLRRLWFRLFAKFEYWDERTVSAEARAFVAHHGMLDGIAEAELRVRFGEPQERTDFGTQVEPNAAEEVFRADYDLRYTSLLPHVTLGLAILEGVVRYQYFLPKARSCSARVRASLGGHFAPE